MYVNKKDINKTITWLIAGIICVGVVVELICMAKYSYLSWTFHQTKYWTAVTEIIVSWIILVCGQIFLQKRKKKRFGFIVAVILAFSYIHQYLAAVVLGIAYSAFIYLVGLSLSDRLCLERICKTWHEKILLGISGTFLLIALASLFKIGTPEKLRILLPYVAILLVILERKKILQCMEECQSKPERELSCLEILILSTTVAFILVQIGRANIALDYDSVWYGLRSEYMLAPKTGIYDEMPFLACVHTYAKGIETLTLPLSGMGSFGFVYSLNIIFGIAAIFCVYDICKTHCSRTLSMFAALCMSAIPGIMNMTVTAKSDILTLFLQVTAFYFLLEGICAGETEKFILSISSCILSCAFKSSSVIFSTVIFSLCIIEVLIQKPKFKEKWRYSISFLCCSILGLGVIFARTWHLTGVPFTFLIPDLVRKMGGEIRYPYEFYSVGSSGMSNLMDATFLKNRLLRILNILFYPATDETDHIIIAWAGPVFALIWLASLGSMIVTPVKTWKKITGKTVYSVIFLTFLILSALTFGCVLLLDRPDGNYFMLLYTVSIVTTEFIFRERMENNEGINTFVMLPVLISALLFTIAGNWAWSLGFTTPSLATLGWYDSDAWVSEYMNSVSLDDIYHQLKSEDKPRVEILSNQMQYAALIPASTDTFPSHRNYGGRSSVATAADYIKYLQFSKMDYLLIEFDYINVDLQAKEIIKALSQDGYLEMSQSNERWALVRVKDDASAESGNSVLDFINRSTIK